MEKIDLFCWRNERMDLAVTIFYRRLDLKKGIVIKSLISGRVCTNLYTASARHSNPVI